MNMVVVSPMSEEFHDWLSKCPVEWWRVEVVGEKEVDGCTIATHVIYAFVAEDDDDDDDD